MRSSNPALARDPFAKAERTSGSGVMTLNGSINKAGFLIGITMLTAGLTWTSYLEQVREGNGFPSMLMWGCLIAGFVLSLVIIFKPTMAPILSPVYAALEGGLLGAITMYMELVYPGIAMQALLGTFGVFILMLMTYRMGWIKVTEKFRSILTMAIGGVALIYLFSIIGSFVGFNIPYIHEGGPIGIGFSVFVCGLAALSLLMDFDLIERGVRSQSPKFMEWYAAFSLLVTLIWLYIEILRLLAKSRK
jgi:uncharacterized YccA/Bax inhibitor family protein